MAMSPEQKALRKIAHNIRDRLYRKRTREFDAETAAAVQAIDPKYKLGTEKISQEWDTLKAESDNQISDLKAQTAEL